jgi:hypothetical protein
MAAASVSDPPFIIGDQEALNALAREDGFSSVKKWLKDSSQRQMTYYKMLFAILYSRIHNFNDVLQIIKPLGYLGLYNFVNNLYSVLETSPKQSDRRYYLSQTQVMDIHTKLNRMAPRLSADISHYLADRLTTEILKDGEPHNLNIILNRLHVDQLLRVYVYLQDKATRSIAKATLDGDKDEADELQSIKTDVEMDLISIMRNHIRSGKVIPASILTAYTGNKVIEDFMSKASYGVMLPSDGVSVGISYTGDPVVDIENTMDKIDELKADTMKKSRKTRKNKRKHTRTNKKTTKSKRSKSRKRS